ncbi:hypothetical protein ACWDTP_09725 [Mycobacterium sp. NPDC003449]
MSIAASSAVPVEVRLEVGDIDEHFAGTADPQGRSPRGGDPRDEHYIIDVSGDGITAVPATPPIGQLVPRVLPR